MPLFFLIFLVLAVRVAFLPGAAEGYKFMFTPRWEALTDPMILAIKGCKKLPLGELFA